MRSSELLSSDLLPLKMGPTGCLETWVRNYRHTLRDSLNDCSSQLTEADNNCFVNLDSDMKKCFKFMDRAKS